MLFRPCWVAKNLYFFNCLLDGAHTTTGATAPFLCHKTENGLRRVRNPWYNKI